MLGRAQRQVNERNSTELRWIAGNRLATSEVERIYRQFETSLNAVAETVTPRGRVAQLGEHLLWKHEPPFQQLHSVASLSNVSNNFGGICCSLEVSLE